MKHCLAALVGLLLGGTTVAPLLQAVSQANTARPSRRLNTGSLRMDTVNPFYPNVV